MAHTLTELATLPGMRVVVATRALAAGNRDRYRSGGVLATLTVTAAASPNLVDLDTDDFFQAAELREFAAALLAQHGVATPGPAGRAWAYYAAHPPVRERLTAVIARRADRNYLVTALAAVSLSEAPTPLDPAAPGFDDAEIPSGVGEALSKYLDTLPERERHRVRGLLTTLAYTRSGGVDDETWLGFTAAMGYPADQIDLDTLCEGSAADYLLQTVPQDSGALTRLFHQALADELLSHRPDHRHDEQKLLKALLAQIHAEGGWPHHGLPTPARRRARRSRRPTR